MNEHRSHRPFSVGAATRDITPTPGTPLAGFAMRDNAPSTGVADPLTLTLALFEDADGNRACVTSADLLNWPRERVAGHRRLLSRALSVPPTSVMLTATHNHSGPQPNSSCARSLGEFDPDYLDFFERELAEAAREAEQNLQTAVAERAVVRHPLAQQRRPPRPGSGAPDPVDDRLTTLLLRTHDGRPLLTLVHYACHPVVSAALEVSPDYPGAARSVLERELGAPAIFLQGFSGDINPGPFTTAGVGEARRIGIELASAAVASLQTRTPVRLDRIRTATRATLLPTVCDLPDLATPAPLVDEWGEARRSPRDDSGDQLDATCLLFSDELGLIGVNGELSSAYALALTDRHGDALLAVGYANGMMGYVPTASQILAGGYEPVESAYYYGMPGRLAPGAQQLVETLLAQTIEEATHA